MCRRLIINESNGFEALFNDLSASFTLFYHKGKNFSNKTLLLITIVFTFSTFFFEIRLKM